MKSILIVGLGIFGKTVAEKMNALGHDVLAVDKNEARINEIMPVVTDAVIGDSTDIGFLNTLGVRNFDLCFVAIGDSFEDSLQATSLLKELEARTVIARASSDVHAKFLLRNGADDVVFPEKEMAEWAAMRYSSEAIIDYIGMKNDYGIFELPVLPEWIDRSVQDLNVRQKYHINILGIRNRGEIDMDIHADTVFREGQSLLVLGKNENVIKGLHLRD